MEDGARIDFTYKKDDNHTLFKRLEENTGFGILKAQNYIPIYNSFFELNKTNANAITLNQRWKLHDILEQETKNIFQGLLKDKSKKTERKVYLKFSPLLDPIKYLIGKYDITDTNLLNLPTFETETSNPKSRDYNNSAYVDSFFTYLTSKLLHDHGFSHGLDFYGSFLAEKTDFCINIIDDIDYLNDSAFFRKNDKILYELENVEDAEMDNDTRNYKKKLNFLSDGVECDVEEIQLNELDYVMVDGMKEVEPELINLEISGLEKLQTKSTNSSCSSRSSNTSNEWETDEDEDASADEVADKVAGGASADEVADKVANEVLANEVAADEAAAADEVADESGSDDDEEILIAKIKKFPVQVIALEHCETTLDDLMLDEKITTDDWDSIILQILFSLITYQNAFGLTHNDLHTNNVMYTETDKKFLYYKINHVYYKVPTFGKLFKIIDYGRAIYKFRGKLLCSDSYHPEGDAATQYNCEPYFNNEKPRLDPNFSFDLCRLGCALYDYLIDEPKSKIVQIMLDWVNDDKGRNILYKKNGDERYPDFKLYKMIARTVNKHVPATVLSNPYFDKFIISKKDVKKNTVVMDLDVIPCYM